MTCNASFKVSPSKSKQRYGMPSLPPFDASTLNSTLLWVNNYPT